MTLGRRSESSRRDVGCNESNPGDASLDLSTPWPVHQQRRASCGDGTWIKPGVNGYVRWGFEARLW